MTPPERAPEKPGLYATPEGVHEVEPEGDDAPAPESDLSGEQIPEDLPLPPLPSAPADALPDPDPGQE